MMPKMRSVDEQLAMVVDAAPVPEPIRVAISDALGLMCAEEVAAAAPLPGFAQAAVDGYAVRAVDVGGGVALGSGPAAVATLRRSPPQWATTREPSPSTSRSWSPRRRWWSKARSW